MSELVVYNMDKKQVGTVKGFEGKARLGLIHQVVTAQQWNRRQGNAKVKSRNEVAGSGRKIYRQKGTGRARHGDIKAHLFIGGGQAFGPKPQNYEVRLPRRVRQAALISAIHHRSEEGRLLVIDDLKLAIPQPKTQKAAELFEKLGVHNGLVVLDKADAIAEKSIRNIPHMKVCRIEALNVLDILKHEYLVMTRGAYESVAGKVA